MRTIGSGIVKFRYFSVELDTQVRRILTLITESQFLVERSWIQDDSTNLIDGGELSGVHRFHRDLLRDTVMGKLQDEEKGDQGKLRVRYR